ncbi:hypothetical protein NQZ68_026602 [Dissostichus eleginoides]|nr:hypothetical protein NQZ68_026602 [Dissostichus eleginoides]
MRQKLSFTSKQNTDHDEGRHWGSLPQEVLLHISPHCLCWTDEGRHWGSLPQEVLLHISPHCLCWTVLTLLRVEPASSYLKATDADFIQQGIKKHGNHLQYVSIKVCTNDEEEMGEQPAEAACNISQLVNCSLNILGLISTARPSIMCLPKMNGERPAQLSIMEEVLLPDHRYGLDDIHWEVLKNLGCGHNGCKNPDDINSVCPEATVLCWEGKTRRDTILLSLENF